jgi:hypothetical protein
MHMHRQLEEKLAREARQRERARQLRLRIPLLRAAVQEWITFAVDLRSGTPRLALSSSSVASQQWSASSRQPAVVSQQSSASSRQPAVVSQQSSASI